MKSFILYGGAIADRDELHETLAMGLGFPEYYGKNLDALHDCLTDIFEEAEIVIMNSAELSDNLGDYASRFIRVLRHSAEENENLRVVIE